MAKARIPRPSYANAGANRDRPRALASEGPTMRRDIERAGFATGPALAAVAADAAAAAADAAAASGDAAAAALDATAALADSATVAANLATHEGAADPHGVYQLESAKGAAGGYASLDGSAKVPTAQLPAIAAATEIVVSANVTVPTNVAVMTTTLVDLATKELTIAGTGILHIA